MQVSGDNGDDMRKKDQESKENLFFSVPADILNMKNSECEE